MAMEQTREGRCYAWDGDTLILDVLGRPGARKDAIAAIQDGRMRIHIAATAEGGRATHHLIGFLAEIFAVPRAAVSLVFGAYSAKKRVRIRAPQRLPPGIERPS